MVQNIRGQADTLTMESTSRRKQLIRLVEILHIETEYISIDSEAVDSVLLLFTSVA